MTASASPGHEPRAFLTTPNRARVMAAALTWCGPIAIRTLTGRRVKDAEMRTIDIIVKLEAVLGVTGRLVPGMRGKTTVVSYLKELPGGRALPCGGTVFLYSWGWRVVETCVKRSASRQGLWLFSVSVDGSRLWHGEEWSREAAVRRVVDILTHLDEQQPDAPPELVAESVSNL